MQQQLVKITSLKNNTGQIKGLPKNPRIIRDNKFIQLKNSIQEDPEMLSLRELIVYDNDGELIVICGNMRLKAIKALGIKEVEVKILPKDTPVQKLKAYTIKDNVGYGDHNWEQLANEWDAEELTRWGLDIPGFDAELPNDEPEEQDANSLIVEADMITLEDLFDELKSRGFNVSMK
jgi:ParB-like chromosome segregation protein Spo0J